jgi:hypothetical protein
MPNANPHAANADSEWFLFIVSSLSASKVSDSPPLQKRRQRAACDRFKPS